MSSTFDSIEATRSADVAVTAPAPSAQHVVFLAEDSLYNTGYAALRQLQCRWHDGVLTVSGSVPTYYTKQVALVALKKTDGIENVADQIEVSWPRSRAGEQDNNKEGRD